jgi:hypothetical protein
MGRIISALLIFSIKAVAKVFYKTDTVWITPKEQLDWERLRLAIVLNHTSLFEPLFVSSLPNYRIWRAITRVVVPIADVTLNRPLVGSLFRFLVPNAVAITRKRDHTWDAFVSKVQDPNSLMLIFPEGRMKRKDGLDKKGQPMSVKGGVADILSLIPEGKILIAYSGGLHHVQAPGELVPRVFKRIQIKYEQVDIKDYKELLKSIDQDEFRQKVIKDLEARMSQHCK